MLVAARHAPGRGPPARLGLASATCQAPCQCAQAVALGGNAGPCWAASAWSAPWPPGWTTGAPRRGGVRRAPPRRPRAPACSQLEGAQRATGQCNWPSPRRPCCQCQADHRQRLPVPAAECRTTVAGMLRPCPLSVGSSQWQCPKGAGLSAPAVGGVVSESSGGTSAQEGENSDRRRCLCSPPRRAWGRPRALELSAEPTARAAGRPELPFPRLARRRAASLRLLQVARDL
jgi:hypothetical protein